MHKVNQYYELIDTIRAREILALLPLHSYAMSDEKGQKSIKTQLDTNAKIQRADTRTNAEVARDLEIFGNPIPVLGNR